MNDGLCQCGCGQLAPIATRTVTSRGRFKGQPMRFIRGHNSYGMDRSKPRVSTRYVEKDRGYGTPCWIWQLKTAKTTGYGIARIKGRDWLAHRWYYEQHVGAIPEGLQIDHLCSQRDCVNPAHLEAVTPLQNARRGRNTKLTDPQAKAIELLANSGMSGRDIGPLFGVSRQTVDLIRQNGADGPRRPV